MKVLLSIFVTIVAWMGPLSAYTSHRLTMDESNIEIDVIQPEGLVEREITDLDLVFQDPEDAGRTFVFHYYKEPGFMVSLTSSVYIYTDWLLGKLSNGSKIEGTAIYTGNDFAVRPFTMIDAQNMQSYGYVYVGKIGDELVISAIVTGSKSEEEAISDCESFLENIFWSR